MAVMKVQKSLHPFSLLSDLCSFPQTNSGIDVESVFPLCKCKMQTDFK